MQNRYKKSLMPVLSAGLLALCAGSTLGAISQPGDAPSTASVAASALDLRAGEERLIADAIANPIEFTAVRGVREFTGELIVHAKRSKQQSAEARVAPLTLATSAFVPERVVKVPAGVSEGELAALLLATGDYEFVEPNWRLFPTVVPDDPQFDNSWQHDRIESVAAWDLHTGGSDVIVAVCDSGVDLDHPDLEDALVPGFNSRNRRAQADGGDVDDINGHGTFVAGCAAAQGDNGRGVTGVGWDFSIMPIRVTNNTNGFANSFDILEGARWAAENGAQVINASFSGGTSSGNQTAARYLKELGSLLFWASGNDNGFVSPNFPDYVLVGATTSSDNRANFSNFGPAVDLTAPGQSVRSTQRFGSYGNSSGTSFASPIAAGVGAMIYSVNPELSGHDVQDILYNSVDDLGAPGRDDFFGRGRVNTRRAIENAQSYVRPIEAPIFSSFEDADWEDLFVVASGSAGTESSVDAPDGSSVLLLDAADVVESVRLAGRTTDDNILEFSLRAQGIDSGEPLLVQFLQNPEIAPDTWTTLTEVTGAGRTGEEFVRYEIELPNAYEWHGVKVRFAAQGADADDRWMIDALSIDTIGPSVAPLVEDFETDMIAPTRWVRADNVQAGLANDNFFAALGDGAVLESRDIPLAQFGVVPAFIRLDAWADGSVSGGDELIVEVLNIGNEWEVVDTISGGDLGGSPELIELDVPFTAWALDTARLRLRASTTGQIRVDKIYVGVDQFSAGCSAADLAEPYGELNFFDISAFLGAFNSADPSADLDGNGAINFFDVSQFLSVFNTGCP